MSESEAPKEAVRARPESGTTGTAESSSTEAGSSGGGGRKRRRRGSRGGRNRSKPRAEATGSSGGGSSEEGQNGSGGETPGSGSAPSGGEQAAAGAGKGRGGSGRDEAGNGGRAPEGGGPAEGSPDAGEPSGEAARPNPDPPDAPAKPKIGDTMPAPPPGQSTQQSSSSGGRRRRGGRRRSGGGGGGGGQGDDARSAPQSGRAAGGDGKSRSKGGDAGSGDRARSKGDDRPRQGGGSSGSGQQKKDTRDQQDQQRQDEGGGQGGRRRRRRGRGGRQSEPVEAVLPSGPAELDEKALAKRRGRERKGRPVGRYLMAVHVAEKASQIAVLEGRSMIEHYVSRPSDDISQIHGNIYLGRVQNVLPGMEAAFVDIGTPKNAVLYRGDVHYDRGDVEHSGPPRIEKMLKAGQTILCQVTKNPIGAKGARLTQEVSLPGRHVVLIPNSSTYGISKRLPDQERKRLRQLLDRVKPKEHGIIVRTAAEGVTSEEVENDVLRLVRQWEQIDGLAKRSKAPALLYREPDMAVRVIREEFNNDYRGVVIDDRQLYEQVRDYVASINPALADRVEYYDPEEEKLPLFERHHVHEQLHRALDRKVWLPSGGSLIIEHTEAFTVIDVNTGKNVGKSSLEETVFKNNLEAAVEIARQLRLRDIGGIIVIDYIDMERRDNRDEVVRVFREALSRDKTRTQVFEISELGLCEMTRKRIGEGLLESYVSNCPMCEGRGHVFDRELLPE